MLKELQLEIGLKVFDVRLKVGVVEGGRKGFVFSLAV